MTRSSLWTTLPAAIVLLLTGCAGDAGGETAPLFVPVAPDTAAGLPWYGKTFGGTWADLDGDGRLDLFLSRHGGGGEIFFDGPGLTFARRQVALSLPTGPYDGHGGAACDVDGDGDGDVLMIAGTDQGRDPGCNALLVQEAPGILVDTIGCDHLLADPGGRGRGALWLDLDHDRFPELLLLNFATAARLFHRDENGWHDWTDRLATASGSPPDWLNTAVAADFDGDGWTDLYAVATTRVLWRNRGRGDLADVTAAAGLRLEGPNLMAAAAGDVDGDGDPDLVTAVRAPAYISVWLNVSDEDGIRFEPGADAPRLPANGEIDSIALRDLDGDGALDLYLALLDHDRNLPNVAWRGRGDGSFEPVADAWGAAAAVAALPAGAWALDLDHDGDLDLAAIHGRGQHPGREGAVLLLENQGAAPGFTLTLSTDDGPSQALGAVAVLRLTDRTLRREVQAGLSYWNSAVLPLHFGVGEARGPFTVEIRWPLGGRQRVEIPAAGCAYRIAEGAGAVVVNRGLDADARSR